MAFGPQQLFERSLGYTVAAFEASGYRPRDEDIYIIHNKPGIMLGRLALRNDQTLFLFVAAENEQQVPPADDIRSQKAHLRRRYQAGGWESSRILDELDGADDLYFDRVSQIDMPAWSHGRIAVVGDAAFCASLMAGQGSALAMTACLCARG